MGVSRKLPRPKRWRPELPSLKFEIVLETSKSLPSAPEPKKLKWLNSEPPVFGTLVLGVFGKLPKLKSGAGAPGLRFWQFSENSQNSTSGAPRLSFGSFRKTFGTLPKLKPGAPSFGFGSFRKTPKTQPREPRAPLLGVFGKFQKLKLGARGPELHFWEFSKNSHISVSLCHSADPHGATVRTRMVS